MAKLKALIFYVDQLRARAAMRGTAQVGLGPCTGKSHALVPIEKFVTKLVPDILEQPGRRLVLSAFC